MKLTDVLDIEFIDKDLYRGASPDTGMQRNFGGQVAAQALVAASHSVDGIAPVHSLHANFLRPGRPGVPTVYRVERLRDGRSFATRRITGLQSGQAVFSMSASFHTSVDQGPEHSDAPPAVPPPDEMLDAALTDAQFQEWHRAEWPDWDIRRVQQSDMFRTEGVVSQQRVWLKHMPALPPDPAIHACALTYASDMTLLGCSTQPYLEIRQELEVASLDHAVWFLRPFRADEWLLYDQTSPSAGNGRALNLGRIYDQKGRLVAAVTQEGLMRRPPSRR